MNYSYHPAVPPFRAKRIYRPVVPVRGLGVAAAALVGTTALAGALLAWVDWRAWSVAGELARRVPGVVESDAYAASIDSLTVRLVFLVLLLMSGGQFILWVWRTRANAEALHMAPQRRDRAWIVAGWFCPVVNLWVPFVVVRDIWEASDPKTPYYRTEFGKVRGAAQIRWWWWSWLIAEAAHAYVLLALFTEPSPGFVRHRAIAETIAAGALLLSAVLLIWLIRQVSWWQSRERTVRSSQFGSARAP